MLSRVRSAEECVALSRLNTTAMLVAAACLGFSGIVLGLAWRVLSG
jgi:hypothetical protein